MDALAQQSLKVAPLMQLHLTERGPMQGANPFAGKLVDGHLGFRWIESYSMW
jgi:hypothetical protein